MSNDYRRRLEIARHRWYLGQNIELAFSELPPHDVRRPRPKVYIDRFIARIRELYWHAWTGTMTRRHITTNRDRRSRKYRALHEQLCREVHIS